MAGGHGSLEASIFDRGIHILAVVAVCHFILCYLCCFITLGGCFLFFLFLATLVNFPFSIPAGRILAYLFITEGLLLSLSSDIRNFPKWWSRYQPPNIMLLQASSRAVVFKLVRL